MTADAVGGVWRYSLDLIEGLAAQGAKVLLATMGPRPSDEQRQQVSALSNVEIAESDYALEWMQNPWTDVDAAGKWLLALAEKFGPDLIHLNGYSHAALPWGRPVVVVAHSCVFSWWRAVLGATPGAPWEEYKRRVAAGLSGSNVMIAPSAAIARAIATEYGVPPEKCRVIHNFSHSENVECPPASGSPHQTKNPFFLAAGRVWDRAKNIALLEQFAPALKWELRVSGSDRGPESSQAAVHSVRFLGMLPYAELLDQMARASVFVHPALYEPFGLSILEAARRGCCLALSDIPTLRELWDSAAVFIDPRNPDQWACELNRLSEQPARRQEFGERARSHARKYHASGALDQYQQIYRSLLRSHTETSSEAAA